MPWTTHPRSAVAGALVALLLGSGPSVASASASASASGSATATAAAPGQTEPVAALAWAPCGTTSNGTAAGVQCATADLPLDYDQPAGAQVHIAVAKVPARDPGNRIGSLFFNPGGPGGAAVEYLQAAGVGVFATLNQRFDIVGFDPRGVGQSTPSIDCRVNQETQGIASVPFPTPLDIDVPAYVARMQVYVDSCLANNGSILEHVSTANVARDMDALRAAVGDDRLTYLGFSYGTLLGSTYAALFPDRYRTLLLDGPVDAEAYLQQPLPYVADQTASFESSLDRFLAACAADQKACSGFGGANPSVAYDDLIASAETTPIPAGGYEPDPRPVMADEIRLATLPLLYTKRLWGLLGLVLAQASGGDASFVRALADGFYGRRIDGTFSPDLDRLFAITAAEEHYPRGDLQPYLDRGAESWAAYPHFWFNSGYSEIPYALWPRRDEDAYDGSFTVRPSSPTPLVVATTNDPATPYEGALNLIRDLGNARLLTMDGDNHTAYGGNSACVNSAEEAYLIDGTLPAEGTVCQQQVPFTAPQPVTTGALRAAAARLATGDVVGALEISRP
jgi:pimeloyl-ACP methyl ester carboxylesterase